MGQRKLGIVINYITLAMNIIIGLFFTPFMILKLGDGLYGVYSLSNSLISLVTLLDLGFGQTIVRYITQAKVNGDIEEERRLNGFFIILYLIISLIALIVGLILVWIYPEIAKQTLTQSEIWQFRIVFLILLINVVVSFPLSVFSATLNAYEQFAILKLINFIMSIFKYVFMVMLLFFGYKLISITIVSFISSIITQIFYVYYCVKKIRIKFVFKKINTELRDEILNFSFYIFLNLIIDFLYANTDYLILGVVSGTMAVSIYTIGNYFSTYFTELSSAMSSVFMPKIVELYNKKDISEISHLFNKIGRFQMAILFLVLGGYICFGIDFIKLWVGDMYYDSYIIGILIMIPSMVPLTQNIGISVIRAMNIHKYRSFMYIIIAILNVIISIPLSIKYNGIGAAIGTCVATICGQVIFMNLFYKKKVCIDINEYWKNFTRFLLLTFVVVAFNLYLKSLIAITTWTSLLFSIFIFTVCYVFLYLFFVANSYEKNILVKLIKKGNGYEGKDY